MEKDGLQDAYKRAGEAFLAADLEVMFRNIKTDEDMAAHNLMQRKIFKMIGQDEYEVSSFYRRIAHKLLEKRAKKSFIKTLCEVIIGERQ